MAVVATAPQRRAHRLTTRGIVGRTVAAVGLVVGIFLIPTFLEPFQANQATRAAIFAVIGLSMNILIGHAGQISLGHQAFVGIGAFTSGWIVSEAELTFWIALPIAGLVGAFSAMLLGLVALRLRGLYLALITLAYGSVAEESIFNIRVLTRGGEGMPAPRPAGFSSDNAYLYLCMLVLGAVLLIDWRLVRSKAGRAIASIRHDERVAATMGVNVTFYKILAFVLSGFIAGLAGSLFAHQQTVVVAEDFVLSVAFVWVFMTVVGGPGSRAGVVIGSAFFAIFPFIFESFLSDELATTLVRAIPLFGAVLLVLTLILYPGGIGQQILPLRRWLAGGPFLEHQRKPKPPKKPGGGARKLLPKRPPKPSGDGVADATEVLPAATPPSEARGSGESGGDTAKGVRRRLLARSRKRAKGEAGPEAGRKGRTEARAAGPGKAAKKAKGASAKAAAKAKGASAKAAAKAKAASTRATTRSKTARRKATAKSAGEGDEPTAEFPTLTPPSRRRRSRGGR